jgi:hypothetical protein
MANVFSPVSDPIQLFLSIWFGQTMVPGCVVVIDFWTLDDVPIVTTKLIAAMGSPDVFSMYSPWVPPVCAMIRPALHDLQALTLM